MPSYHCTAALICELVKTAMLLSYLLYNWTTNEFHRLQRKNPADFVDDV